MAAPLHFAVRRGDLDEVQRLVQTPGIEVDGLYYDGTPLCYAAEHNQLNIARVLIAAGADVNWASARLDTPLHGAASFGHKELELLDAGANPDGQHNDGYYNLGSPLQFAAGCGRRKCVGVLLAANADPNLENLRGQIALNFALHNLRSAPGIISDLLSYGANVMHRDKAGRTALQELQYFVETHPGLLSDYIRPHYCQAVSILVAAGDMNWDCVPVPCSGIERALLPVWRAAPEELPEVVKRLGEDVKRLLHATIFVIDNRLPVDLRMKVLGEVLLE